MKKQYPYLEDSYFYNTDVERQKRTVLEDIQNFANQRQYIKITLLNWEEQPLKEIEGEISSGSISKNADSPVRRTANLSCAVDARSYSVDDGKADFAINKKVFIEIGILNETDKYPEFPIFWFPQGVFFIGSFAINSSSTGSTNINLTLKDKMAMLNGDVGGTLPALVVFDSMDTQLPDGSYATQKVLIYNIIKECVNHYGGEDLNNIVIEDIPLRIRRVMRWTGSTPLYMVSGPDIAQLDNGTIDESDFHFQLEEPDGLQDKYQPYDEEDNPIGYKTFYNGDDVGYIRDDFVVTDELVGNAGETVTSILDKIKDLLGNYEYFYDVFGVFHFREIKNYLNTTQGEKLLSEMAEKDYLVEVNNERSTFTFSDETILTSITVTPKYENIKNDFIIQGLREGSSSDIAYDIRYHLAIDTKPRPIGIDDRSTIAFPKDFSKAIAAGKEDVLTLQNKISDGNYRKRITESSLERLERQKEARYREVIKYGDLLKRELQFILGDFSYPQGQLVGKSGLNRGYAEYSNWNENTGLPNNRPRFYYRDKFWNEYEQQFSIGENDNPDFIKELANISLKYDQNLFDNLTPEGFWEIIYGTWLSNSPLNKILQEVYKIELLREYREEQAIWNDAVSKINSGVDGYKYITDKMIQTNEKIYIYEPIAPQLDSYPDNFYNVSLANLCQATNDYSSLKNIYTNYILSLTLKKTQQNNIIGTTYNTWTYKGRITNLKNNGDLPVTSPSQGWIYDVMVSSRYGAAGTTVFWTGSQWETENGTNLAKQISINTKRLNYFNGLKENWTNSTTIPCFSYRNSANVTTNELISYTECCDYVLQLQQQKLDLFSAELNTQENNNSLSNLYSNDYLSKRQTSLHDLYEQYQTELKNLYIVIQKIEDINSSDSVLEKISDKEIHEFLSSLKSKDYSLAVEVSQKNTVIEALEVQIINPSFNPQSQEKRRDYITTWTDVLTNLGQIIQNWEKGAMDYDYPNAHFGHKYYAYYDSIPVILYKDPETSVVKAGFCFVPGTSEEVNLPVPGNFNLIYKRDNGQYCYWDGQTYKDLEVVCVFDSSSFKTRYYVYDWRTALYLQGQYARIMGTDAGYYYPELSAFWPSTYDLLNQRFYDQVRSRTDTNDRDLAKGNYYLDFLDSVETTFGEWSVDNIGRRSDVVVNNDINCLFQPEIPNVNLINTTPMGLEMEIYDVSNEVPDSLRYLERIKTGNDETLVKKGQPKIMYLRAESMYENEPFSQVDNSIYNNLLTGGYANGAFDQIKYELFLHTRYQKSISMTSIPVFYLEPNSRVTLADKTTNTFGDFVINNISLTLGPGANMSVSMVETIERF